MNKEGRRKGTRKTPNCMLWLGKTTRLLVRGQQGLEKAGQNLPSSLGVSMVKWADSALEKRDWVNMRLPLPTGSPPGWPEPGPWVYSYFLKPIFYVRLT